MGYNPKFQFIQPFNIPFSFLSADSISSALLVGLSGEEEGGRKEEGLFSNSLVEMEELKV